MRYRLIAVTTALALGLVACPPAPQNRSISGTVSFGTGVTSAPVPSKDLVPGEVIIKFRSTSSAQSLSRLAIGGLSLERVRPLAVAGTTLYRATNLDAQGTLALAGQVASRADVEYAQPNYIDQAFKTPNDEFYSFQWHYPAINLPQAWDVVDGTQGTPVVVAVVDTGILWAGDGNPKTHPDLNGKVLPGYDMISDPRIARDGDGRDADPFDVGDLAEPTQSSYHGSHVAGTIAAATNNTNGVAGVSWGAKILPVRVLGEGGGALSDISDGILWAAGVSVPGAPANPNPAKVINLSLGGNRPCSDTPVYQDAINQARAKGAVVVVAAGNSNADTANFTPASCSGTVTVGATDFLGQRAPYSNFGSLIDVMAPGGDTSQDANSDGKADGVLSLGKDDSTGNFVYVFENGTSMAAPHVAGVAALLKARNPNLTPDAILEILKTTASARSGTQCQGRNGAGQSASDCGAGLIDAFAAVNAATGGTTAPNFFLSLSQGSLSVAPNSSAQVNLNLECVGGFNASPSLNLNAPQGVTGTTGGALNCGGSVSLNLSVGALAAGAYTVTVTGTSGSLTSSASLSLVVRVGGTGLNVQNTFVAALFVTSSNQFDINKSSGITITQSGTSAPYSVAPLETGNYLVIAWKDINGNQDIDDGDFVGLFNDLVTPTRSSVNLTLGLVSGTTRLSAANLNDSSLRQAVRSLVFSQR